MVRESKLEKGMMKGAAKYNGRSWEHRYKVALEDGTIAYRRKMGFATAEEANESYKSCEEEFQKQLRSLGMATRMDGKMMFLDYLKYFLEDVLSPKCQPQTKIVYSYVLYRYVIPVVETDISLELINATYLNNILDLVAPITKSAANKTREFFYLALCQAKSEKRIDEIPKMKKCPRAQSKVNILTKDQIKVLLKAAYSTNWYLEILLGLFVGLRKGEILGLKFDDFDVENQAVQISRQLSLNTTVEAGSCERVSATKVEKGPKSDNSYRTIYVPEIVLKELEERKNRVLKDKKKAGTSYVDEGYVCCQSDGTARGITSMNTCLARLCKKNGLPHITVHSLRHGYATILLEQGYTLQVVSALLGHSSINTTFEFYAEVMEDKGNIKAYLNELYPMEDDEDDSN